MGACLSSPSASVQQPNGGSKALAGQQGKQGTHDSVHSVDTAKLKQHAAAAAPRKQRAPQFDLATGQPIPDLGVYGVFDVLSELGSGGSGRTYLCRDLGSGKVVAVKFVPRPLAKAAVPFMLAEIEIQAQLGEGSINIVTLHEMVLTRTHLALVMEYASGGCLTSAVSCLWETALLRRGLFMEEQEACYFMLQFMHALAYCHQHKVAHRDLKLDNTLLEETLVGPPRLKICDFGFAKAWHSSNADANMKTAIGTPVYMSPQMLAARQCASGYSGIKADMWAAGVLLFVMLAGDFPFDHATDQDPNSLQAAGEVWLKQHQASWRAHPKARDLLSRNVLTPACLDLLDGLLQLDEDKRYTTDQVLAHPWLATALGSEQQAAWDRMQAEQAEAAAQLAAAKNPRLAKLRKEAMFAMLALSTKPGTRGSLLPKPSDIALAGAASGGGGASGALSSGSGNSAAAGGGLAGLAAAMAAAGSGGSGPLAAPGPACVPRDAAATGPGAAGDALGHGVASPTAAAAGALAAEAEAEAGDEPGPLPPVADAKHWSFQAGEGLRSGSLERKVEAYTVQSGELRAQRIAAAVKQAQEAQAGGNDAAGGGGDSSGGGDDTGRRGLASVPSGKRLAGEPPAPARAGSSRALVKLKSLKSPFAAAAGEAPACSGGDSGSDGPDEDGPDEVWRLPLTSVADPGAFRLSPELSVAAGALVRQLQGIDSKVAGRGRSNRGSCPVN